MPSYPILSPGAARGAGGAGDSAGAAVPEEPGTGPSPSPAATGHPRGAGRAGTSWHRCWGGWHEVDKTKKNKKKKTRQKKNPTKKQKTNKLLLGTGFK